MRRLATIGMVLALAVFAVAMTTFGKVFEATYKLDKDSGLAKARCMTCHLSAKGGKFNPYGKALHEAMGAAHTKKLTAEILKKVENLDSDGDGKKNIDEIKADKFPGVKGS